jgi:hypothetical protein
MDRSMLSAALGRHRLVAGVVVGPLIVPFIYAAELLIQHGVTDHPFTIGDALDFAVSGFVIGAFAALPVAYVITVAIGLPAVIICRRIAGRVTLVAAASLGGVLALAVVLLFGLLVNPSALLASARDLSSFAISALALALYGVATACVGWWVAFRRNPAQ